MDCKHRKRNKVIPMIVRFATIWLSLIARADAL